MRKDEKYILWPDFKHEQYFNLQADPMEQNDRISDQALQPRLLELRQRFLALKEAAR